MGLGSLGNGGRSCCDGDHAPILLTICDTPPVTNYRIQRTEPGSVDSGGGATRKLMPLAANQCRCIKSYPQGLQQHGLDEFDVSAGFLHVGGRGHITN